MVPSGPQKKEPSAAKGHQTTTGRCSAARRLCHSQAQPPLKVRGVFGSLTKPGSDLLDYFGAEDYKLALEPLESIRGHLLQYLTATGGALQLNR